MDGVRSMFLILYLLPAKKERDPATYVTVAGQRHQSIFRPSDGIVMFTLKQAISCSSINYWRLEVQRYHQGHLFFFFLFLFFLFFFFVSAECFPGNLCNPRA